MTTDAKAHQPAPRFGTFLGVFTPSVLTILGLACAWLLADAGWA